MTFLVATLLSAAATFSAVWLFHSQIKRKPIKLRAFKIHHSVLGLGLLAGGLLARNDVVAAIGLGIYVSHGFEEMYFNKKPPPRAFLIFITRET